MTEQEIELVQLYSDFIKQQRGETLSSQTRTTLGHFNFDKQTFQALLAKSPDLHQLFYNKTITVNLHTDGPVGHVSGDLPLISEDGTITIVPNIGLDPKDGEPIIKRIFGAEGAVASQQRARDSRHLLTAAIPVTHEQYINLANNLKSYIANPPTYRMHGYQGSNCIQWMDTLLSESGIYGGLKNRFSYEEFQRLDFRAIKLQANYFFDEFVLTYNQHKITAAFELDQHQTEQQVLQQYQAQFEQAKLTFNAAQIENDIQLFLNRRMPFHSSPCAASAATTANPPLPATDDAPESTMPPQELPDAARQGITIQDHDRTQARFTIASDQNPYTQWIHRLLQTAAIYAEHSPFNPLEITMRGLSSSPSFTPSVPEAFSNRPRPGEWEMPDNRLSVDKITLSAEPDGIVLKAHLLDGSSHASFKLDKSGIALSATSYFGPQFWSGFFASAGIAVGVAAIIASIDFGLQKHRDRVKRKLNRVLLNDTRCSIEKVQAIHHELATKLGQPAPLTDLLKDTKKAIDQVVIERDKEQKRADKAAGSRGGKGIAKQHAQIARDFDKEKNRLITLQDNLLFESIKEKYIQQHANDPLPQLIAHARQIVQDKALSPAVCALASGLSVLAKQHAMHLLIHGDSKAAEDFLAQLQAIRSATFDPLPSFTFHERSHFRDEFAHAIRAKERDNRRKVENYINDINQTKGGTSRKAKLAQFKQFLEKEYIPYLEEQYKDEKEHMQGRKILDSVVYYNQVNLNSKTFQQPADLNDPLDLTSTQQAAQFFINHTEEPMSFFITHAKNMSKPLSHAFSETDLQIRQTILGRFTHHIFQGDVPLQDSLHTLNDFKEAFPEQSAHVEDLREALIAIDGCGSKVQNNDTTEGSINKLVAATEHFLAASKASYKAPPDARSVGNMALLDKGHQLFMNNIYNLAKLGAFPKAISALEALSQQHQDKATHYNDLRNILAHPNDDSWGGPEWLRFLGGRQALQSAPTNNAPRQTPNEFVDVPQGYAYDHAWMRTKRNAHEKLIELQRDLITADAFDQVNQEQLHDEIRRQQCLIANADYCLSKRLNDLTNAGYSQYAKDLMDEISVHSDKYLAERAALAHRMNTERLGHFTTYGSQLAQNYLMQSNRTHPSRFNYMLLNTLQTIDAFEQLLLPNLKAMLLQSFQSEARHQNIENILKLLKTLTSPRSFDGFMLWTKIALKGFPHLPTENSALQSLQSNVSQYAPYVFTGINLTSAINQLSNKGILAPPSAVANVTSAALRLLSMLQEHEWAESGLMPEHSDYYFDQEIIQGATTLLGSVASLWVSIWTRDKSPPSSSSSMMRSFVDKALKTSPAPLCLLALGGLSLWMTPKNTATKKALDAARQNINVMKALDWEINYFEETPYLYLNEESLNEEHDKKVHDGELIALQLRTDKYYLHFLSSDKKVTVKAIEPILVQQTQLSQASQEHSPSITPDIDQEKFSRSVKWKLISHPIFLNLKKMPIRLRTGPLTNEQLASDCLGWKYIVLERNAERYLLHVALPKDPSHQPLQSIVLESAAMLDNLPWDDKNLTKDQKIDLKCLFGRAIADHYMSRSTDRINALQGVLDDAVVNSPQPQITRAPTHRFGFFLPAPTMSTSNAESDEAVNTEGQEMPGLMNLD